VSAVFDRIVQLMKTQSRRALGIIGGAAVIQSSAIR
jgi:hypothetical protein